MNIPQSHDDLLKELNNFSDLFSAALPKRSEIVRDLIASKGYEIPTRLYHYTDLDGLRGILQSNLLWATDARALNDRTELIYGAALLVSELEKFSYESNETISSALIKLAGFYKEHGNHLLDFFETYVISLSEAPDMLSQWRAYSNQAMGCCLEFDFSDSRVFTISDGSIPIPLEILPVIYNETTQRALIRSGIEKVLNYLHSILMEPSELKLGVITGWVFHAFKPYLMAFKHPGFAEEKEWRVVASCPKTMATSYKRQRNTGSEQISYTECLFLQENTEKFWQREILPITGIKFGPLADDLIRADVNKWLSTHGYEKQATTSNSCIPLRV